MNLDRLPSSRGDHDALSTLSKHMYAKHRNIFIGIGVVIVSGLTSFVLLRNHTFNNRDRLARVRREIQQVTPGSESVFEEYHVKLKQRQAEKERLERERATVLAKN